MKDNEIINVANNEGRARHDLSDVKKSEKWKKINFWQLAIPTTDAVQFPYISKRFGFSRSRAKSLPSDK